MKASIKGQLTAIVCVWVLQPASALPGMQSDGNPDDHSTQCPPHNLPPGTGIAEWMSEACVAIPSRVRLEQRLCELVWAKVVWAGVSIVNLTRPVWPPTFLTISLVSHPYSSRLIWSISILVCQEKRILHWYLWWSEVITRLLRQLILASVLT